VPKVCRKRVEGVSVVRLAASPKMGWSTASLLVGKLQSHRRQIAVLRALEEYGRLIKTIDVVCCLDSPEYRRRIGIQLNKGESLHDLRRFLFFANQGEMRRAQHEDQTVQALCLNVVTNAVITRVGTPRRTTHVAVLNLRCEEYARLPPMRVPQIGV
jgi:TnpA family transposase